MLEVSGGQYREEGQTATGLLEIARNFNRAIVWKKSGRNSLGISFNLSTYYG